jgi:hypothetical protein
MLIVQFFIKLLWKSTNLKCRSEIRSFFPKKEHKMQMFEKKEMRKIYGLNRDEES